jgi:hypothetical protein
VTRDEALTWSLLTDKRSATALQDFTCTQPRERSSQGRRLPHPRPWEREAQSLLRQAKSNPEAGELVLVGRPLADEASIAAAAFLALDSAEVPSTFIRSCGVVREHRGHDGSTADLLIEQIIAISLSQLQPSDSGQLVIYGNVHVHNRPCEALLERHAFEPVGIPHNNYSQWARRVLLT